MTKLAPVREPKSLKLVFPYGTAVKKTQLQLSHELGLFRLCGHKTTLLIYFYSEFAIRRNLHQIFYPIYFEFPSSKC